DPCSRLVAWPCHSAYASSSEPSMLMSCDRFKLRIAVTPPRVKAARWRALCSNVRESQTKVPVPVLDIARFCARQPALARRVLGTQVRQTGGVAVRAIRNNAPSGHAPPRAALAAGPGPGRAPRGKRLTGLGRDILPR